MSNSSIASINDRKASIKLPLKLQFFQFLKLPTCSHSRSINASKPLTVLQSGFRMICAIEVTHNVRSLPSDPCTTTDALS